MQKRRGEMDSLNHILEHEYEPSNRHRARGNHKSGKIPHSWDDLMHASSDEIY